jgi:hypothetical protein
VGGGGPRLRISSYNHSGKVGSRKSPVGDTLTNGKEANKFRRLSPSPERGPLCCLNLQLPRSGGLTPGICEWSQEAGLPDLSPLVAASTVSLGSGFVGERVNVGDMENEIAFAKATRARPVQVSIVPKTEPTTPSLSPSVGGNLGAADDHSYPPPPPGGGPMPK